MARRNMYLVITADQTISDDLTAHLQTLGALELLSDPSHTEQYGYGAQVILDHSIDVEALRAEFASVDFNIVPQDNRRKRLLIADMDSTVIPVECIDEIADLAGVKAQVSEITERAMQGELDFEEALAERVALLKGIKTDALESLYQERINLNPGAQTLVQTMNGQGAKTALVSGGFTFFSERVARDAGFSSHQANTLDAKDGALTGNVIYPVLGQQAKLDALQDFMKQDNLTPADVLAVGDGANDLMMIKHVDMGVAYRAKPIVAQQASHVINGKNLCALLYLQGYKNAEFTRSASPDRQS